MSSTCWISDDIDHQLSAPSQRVRFACVSANNTAKAHKKPSDAPSPMNSGLGLRIVSKYTRLNSTGIADADSGSQERSSANNERAVSSSSAQPIKLGANPRHTADTTRVESAVKLPRSKRSAITGSPMAPPTAPAATDHRPAS